MNRYLCLGLISVMLAGCNQSAQQSAAPTGQSAASVQTSGVKTAITNPDFPTGFEPPFAYRIRSRKIEDDGSRKLFIEFKQGDVATVDKQIETILLAKGFRRYKTIDQNGSLVGDYGNAGKRVTVTVNPSIGKPQLDADSLGTVYFIWKG